MMLTLTEEMIATLRKSLADAGSRCQVCAGFDAVPVSQKPDTLFLVVSPEQITLSCAFTHTDGIKRITPFKADFHISIVAPMTTPGEKLLDAFYTLVLPGIQATGCMLHSVQTGQPTADARLQKLVYRGSFRLCGLYVPEVSA